MDPKLFLAENVLNERRPITYRSLSRALKVHANRAKQYALYIILLGGEDLGLICSYRLLYEFHRNENTKNPGSVHATYVITGLQSSPSTSTAATNGNVKDEDEVMQSSPYLPSSIPNQDSASEPARFMAVMLAREEDLDEAKSTFHSISTIHVYSIQSTILQDLNVLVDVAREVATTHAQDDPLECGKQWGMIQNRNVKRRTGARPPPPAPSKTEPKAAPKVKPEPTIPAKRPLQKESSIKEESKAQPSSANDSDASSKSAKPAPKHEKGSLFSSFAKAKPKAKTTKAPEPVAPPPGEDMVLDDASEEEQEELFPNSGEKSTSEMRERKKEREEKLKQMMEDDDADDEEMPDADEEEPAREPTPVEQPPPPKPTELKEEVTVQGGRRRGKRQVMKKRTMKDEEGFLVTREEATWESFSEDEPAPPKKKPAVNVPKGKGPKPGQGNIMSFFGKK
ncbi:hypothetical protein N7493_009784 [Penicillium malachiteum]|uniref:DNA polymerase delta subunit 3 n=1 Tax=Penicillium malachiteum TaxID=1324776 RepID=A0AAD6HEV8_9EURO|nr:hypothetical protein N7493_009784 [Penicillium malachiteum]